MKISLINTIVPHTPKLHRIQKYLRHSCRSEWDVFQIMYSTSLVVQRVIKKIINLIQGSCKVGVVICSFLGNSPGVWVLTADVSELTVGSIFIGRWMNYSYFIHLPMKMEPTVSSETSAVRTQTSGNYPKGNKSHLEHGESLKTRK